MVPAVGTTPAGPVVPQYLTLLTTSASYSQEDWFSTAKDTTVIGKAGTLAMVHVSSLLYGDALDTQSPLTVHAPVEVNAPASGEGDGEGSGDGDGSGDWPEPDSDWPEPDSDMMSEACGSSAQRPSIGPYEEKQNSERLSVAPTKPKAQADARFVIEALPPLRRRGFIGLVGFVGGRCDEEGRHCRTSSNGSKHHECQQGVWVGRLDLARSGWPCPSAPPQHGDTTPF